MDDLFWASVLRRWSEATETIVHLRKELADAQQECQRHSSDQANTLPSEGSQQVPSSSAREITPPPSRGNNLFVVEHEAALNKLKGAELGLERAKSEYARLREQLHVSSEAVQTLTAEKDTLLKLKDEQRDYWSAQVQSATTSLCKLQTTTEQLKHQVVELDHKNETLTAQFQQERGALTSEIDRLNNVENMTQEKQAAIAQSLLHDKQFQKELDMIRSEQAAVLTELRGEKELNAQLNQKIRGNLREIESLSVKTDELIEYKSGPPLDIKPLTLKSEDCFDALQEENRLLAKQLTSARLMIENLQSKQIQNTQCECESSKGQLEAKIVSLEEEMRNLALQQETTRRVNDELHEGLISSQESLQRAKEHNKGCLATIASLQEVIHNTLSGHPNLSYGMLNAPSSTPAKQRRMASAPPSGSIPTRAAKVEMFEVALSTPIRSSTRQSITEVQSDPTTSIPEHRQRTLSSFPQIIPDVESRAEDYFTRDLLKTVIGGSIQSLIVRVTDSQTELAKGRNISSYLCPGIDHNPWCPSTPGQHGFMFVGLGREKATFSQPEVHNLFVGSTKGRRQRRYLYMGMYSALRVEPLNVAEWNSLASNVKHIYASRTKEKAADPRSVDEILTAYNTGELCVPCVRLQCVDFDETLFAALLHAKNTITPSPKAIGKRRRVENDGENDNPGSGRTKGRIYRKSL
ncbi:hypothetical protein BD779DRAFT_1484828 [Infundibulicybe gibba]|nr:hypothetical protein BD779DRAFT_1484828 [Infundibulicybe gibba]